jgi:hypothetical protein
MPLSHFSCVQIGVMCSGHTTRKWKENFKSFFVCLRRQPLGKDHARQREGYHAMSFSISSIVLFATIMCPNRPLLSNCKIQYSLWGIGDAERRHFSRIARNNRAPAIRCRIHKSDGQSRVKYLNSKYASCACQSDFDSIYPFSHGNSGSLPSASPSLEFGVGPHPGRS